MQQWLELAGGYGSAEQVSHEMLAAVLHQQGSLLQRFNPRGNHHDLRALSQCQGSLRCGFAGIVRAQALHQ